jgi:hypothetical protein
MRRRWDMRPTRHAAVEALLTAAAFTVLVVGTIAIALSFVNLLALGG